MGICKQPDTRKNENDPQRDDGIANNRFECDSDCCPTLFQTQIRYRSQDHPSGQEIESTRERSKILIEERESQVPPAQSCGNIWFGETLFEFIAVCQG